MVPRRFEMNKNMDFNTSDTHISHRLHLNESDSNNLLNLNHVFLNEFKKISIHPDPGNTDLKNKISYHCRVSPDMVVLGNGIDEIILLLSLTFLKNKKTILTSEATFPGYETSAKIVGGNVIYVPLNDMRCSIDNYQKNIASDVILAYLCNPHNPTGSIVSVDEVINFIEIMNDKRVIPIIDEAYIQFSDENKNSILKYIANGGRAIVLRTFSKAYGLAGLRVGFAVGPKDLIHAVSLTALALPFRINRFAQRMASEVLASDILSINVRTVKKLISTIELSFSKSEVTYIPSSTNFVCFKPPMGNTDFLIKAEKFGVMVRDCGLFGLPGWIRASVSNKKDVDCLLFLLDITSCEENQSGDVNE
ncbi:hypothetical protein CKY10_07810 [Photorhabdus sp. HUG-39]|uniref:Aminotransferase class I/II-fold pyridoxal phosphate-dependent enzyme n=2 Tax=Morganellaceae TaxID=1903414 RepID=A0ABX0AZJ8_9GAMM|nr:aminotransferase class I/II-fold pyridoxal phosphate-dependent enzyme [Photorhabdus kayaii]NDL25311.1 aminotransferase class I/II-fold pyridoxal phosphate-dependent enzyme [Photorhabdus kayaii]RAX10451.1 hypothetical protein CKY10_07810 [Photorhabdus sp. HUG-39]